MQAMPAADVKKQCPADGVKGLLAVIVPAFGLVRFWERKEQIKKKAKESIMDKLAKGKISADRKNRERWEREGRIAPEKKNDMEL